MVMARKLALLSCDDCYFMSLTLLKTKLAINFFQKSKEENVKNNSPGGVFPAGGTNHTNKGQSQEVLHLTKTLMEALFMIISS